MLRLPSVIALFISITLIQFASGSENHVSTDRIIEQIYTPNPNTHILAIGTHNSNVFVNGGIVVRGTDDSTIHVIAQLTVTGPRIETCQRLVDEISMSISFDGDEAILDVDTPDKFSYNTMVDYEITVPRRYGLIAQTLNGQVSITDVEGPIEVNTANGKIEAHGVKGNIDATALNGSIDLADVSSKAIHASTLNGEIEIKCSGNSPDTLDVDTKNGAISILLAPHSDARLEISNVSGGIRVNLGEGAILSKSRGEAELTLGSGKGEYSVRNINGSISLHLIPAE